MNATKITAEFVSSRMPARSDSGNKGTFGQFLLVAGSRYMTGAPQLAVSSALRSGTGLVRLFAPDDAMVAVRNNCPCAVLSSSDREDYLAELFRLAGRCAASGIGPGIDHGDPQNDAMLSVLIENAPKLIIDASALTILAKHRDMGLMGLADRPSKGLAPAILTPHIGEFKRFGYADIDFEDYEGDVVKNAAITFSKTNNCILVLKNHITLVTTPEGKCYYIKGDNSGMAKGGSGDVLTGLIGGFLASGFEPEAAALAGVYVHSRGGQIAADDLGKLFMLPTDVIDRFPQVYKELGW